MLTDRAPGEALPALQVLGHDVKAEPLEAGSIASLLDLSPAVVLVDAAAEPDRAFGVLSAGGWPRLPVQLAECAVRIARFVRARTAGDR